jgi:plasmid stabilization system protein ParE
MADRPRSVVWTQTAREQLDEIVGYIAGDSFDAALRVLDRILDAAESLSRLAHRGRVVPEIEDGKVREIFVFSYRLMYELQGNEVQILSVIHSARDFPAWLERHGRPTGR